MKISDYEKVTTLGGGDKFLVDKPEIGTKTIEAADMLRALKETIGADGYLQLLKDGYNDDKRGYLNNDYHLIFRGDNSAVNTMSNRQLWYEMMYYGMRYEEKNCMLHGKNLGNVFTDDQKDTIQEGIFSGMNLGDYWLIGGHRYNIVGFNIFHGQSGNTTISVRNPGPESALPYHLVIYVSTGYGVSAFNKTGEHPIYTDTDLYKDLQPGGRYHALAAADFGSDWIVPHFELLPSSLDDNGKPLGFATVKNYLNLLSLTNLGIGVDNKTSMEVRFETPRIAFPLFQFLPSMYTIGSQGDKWLRTVQSRSGNTIRYYHIAGAGQISISNDTSITKYVCPYFLLGKFKE